MDKENIIYPERERERSEKEEENKNKHPQHPQHIFSIGHLVIIL